MFRTIVVGYDAPGRGGAAVALATALRDPRRGSLLLVSAYPLVVSGGAFVLPEDVREPTEELLESARAEISEDVPVRIAAVPAGAARALTETAEREHADLVVVGSSRHGAIGRVLPGTTAERLLHGAPCAVAVAPRGYEPAAVHSIAVAYDGSAEAEASLQAAEALALELGAALNVYIVIEPVPATGSMIAAGTGSEWPSVTAKEHARELERAVRGSAPAGLRLETYLLHGRAAEQIAHRCAAVDDLLFVGSRGYGPLRRALLGSVSGELVRTAGCPVIVMPRSAIVARRTAAAPAAGAHA
jgi:nucleotide-binding universal stress UspA family protein